MENNRSIEKDVIEKQILAEKKFFLKNFECDPKNSQSYLNYKNLGNRLYCKKVTGDEEILKIFEAYSQSIACAPCNSEYLEIAYGNRSALLLRMKKYKECIIDINRALEIGKSKETFKFKLLCRKVECLAALGSSDSKKVYNEVVHLSSQLEDQSNNNDSNDLISKNLNKAFEAVENLNSQPYVKKKEKTSEHLKILQERENENPSSYSYEYNEKFGRHITAAKDIEPGQIIAVEKPYVSCLNFSKFYHYCGHCFKKTWNSLPCDYCNWCMFCSEECKKQSWTAYHDVECKVITLLRLYNIDLDYNDQLCLRSFILGIREYESISNFKKDLQFANNWIDNARDYNKTIAYYNNGFKSVYTLGNQISMTRFLQKYVGNVVKILITLLKSTSFLGTFEVIDCEELVLNDKILFFGEVLLKLKLQFSKNALKFQNDQSSILKTDKENECISWGACIAPLTSFITHSCYPNAKACITGNQELVIYSLLPIKKNTQITIGYQYTFYEKEIYERNNWIMNHFFVNCDCEACSKFWPTLAELYDMPKKNPRQYAMSYKKMESDLFDENNALVSSILKGLVKAQFNKKILKLLMKALDKALTNLEQPSVVICELIKSLSITFENLYDGSSLMR